MKRKLTIAALLMITVPAFSQFKQSDVVSSAGGFEVKDGYSLSYTIGEPVAGTLKAGDLIIVQGFQQGYITESVTPPPTAIGNEPVPPSATKVFDLMENMPVR